MITVAVANQQDALPLDRRRLRRAVRVILADEGIRQGEISVAVVDDAVIRRLHRQYLNRDCPTDVLSFALERGDGSLVGEVVVSAETALAAAPRFGWPAEHELLLYVIHGVLHLVGCGDATRRERAEMRRREQGYLARLGVQPPPCPPDAPCAIFPACVSGQAVQQTREDSVGVKKTGKGRRKLGRKKRRMRAKIRHRKG